MNPLQIEKLCTASIQHTKSPYDNMPWTDSVDWNAWYMSPELISIYGTEVFKNLTEAEQKKLAFYEAVNFFSLNIHGEKPLVQGLADRLYRDDTLEISPYLHHFLDEENDHMVYFGGFCSRYAKKVYRDKKFSFPREYAEGEEDFLFFLKVVIFEEVADAHNVRMAKDDRLHPLAREINKRHHLDEARHLVFGRALVKELFEKFSPKWSAEKKEELSNYISNYIIATWKEYSNPEVYEDAGLKDPYDLVDLGFESEFAKLRRKEITANCIRYLLENKMTLSEPQL